MVLPENEVENIKLLSSIEDAYGGVTVEMKEPMDSKLFASMLGSSLSYWIQQKKSGVWIKLPIQFSNLVEPAVKEGFRYHHAESDYLMLVKWILETSDTLPANASHHVGIGAFVMNDKGEILVVQERNGSFKGTNLWKLPTGTVDEGEDISKAAIREVKEETGVDTEFVEALPFSHRPFFRESDLFFVCMLRPHSFEIRKHDSEIEAAQWMRAEDYAAQPFNQKNEIFKNMAGICLTKSKKDYTGFSTMSSTTSSEFRGSFQEPNTVYPAPQPAPAYNGTDISVDLEAQPQPVERPAILVDLEARHEQNAAADYDQEKLDSAVKIIGLCLSPVIAMAVEFSKSDKSHEPSLAFNFLSLAFILSFTSLLLSKFVAPEFPKIAKLLERIGVFLAIMVIYTAISIPLHAWFKYFTWTVFVVTCIAMVFWQKAATRAVRRRSAQR